MRLNVVVIGGGTGNFTVLKALGGSGYDLSAIVAMADDGGGTGVLRDELGVLPAGDVRQCLTALSESPKMRELFEYRFEDGTFGGHSVGNLLLTALEKISGSFAEAVETAGDVLNIRGRVIPATFDNVRLKMTWPEDAFELEGEAVIDAAKFAHDPRKAEMTLVPTPLANPEAAAAIQQADIVIIAPGDVYTSLAPTLVIDEIAAALRSTRANVLVVCNLVTKYGQTDGFNVQDHVSELERFARGGFVDAVLYNTGVPSRMVLDKYQEKGANLVDPGSVQSGPGEAVGCDLLGPLAVASGGEEASLVTRSLIRHDGEKLRKAIVRYAQSTSGYRQDI